MKRKSQNHSNLTVKKQKYNSQLIKPPTSPKSINSIKNRWKWELGVEIKSHWIRQYLKDDFHYNYKRGNDRNAKVKDPSSIYKQVIFSCCLFNEIQDDVLITNIDESSFSWSVKSNYSWLPANRSWES